MSVAPTATSGLTARSACRRVIPHVLEPGPEELYMFSAGEKQALRALISKPVEYIDHPMFHEDGCEQILFGSGDRPLNESTGGNLSEESEEKLYLRYNYARFRVASILKRYNEKRIPAPKLRSLLDWSARAIAVRNQIVEPNMPLVLAMIRRNRLLNLDINDLISEGNLALLRCVDKFDCSRGNKFSTYACRSILKSFARVALRTSRYRARFRYEYEPTLERGDFIEQCRLSDETMCLEEVRRIMRENRAALSDIEMRVIQARFLAVGNGQDPGPQTLEQIGDTIGVTKERVRQIQLKALRKLRLTLEDRLLA